MNILFFLTPKSEVDCIYEDDTLKQAMERMGNHQFTSLPLINERTGKYIGTISEGDLLREISRRDDQILRLEEEKPIMKVRRKRDYRSVRASADIEKVLDSAQEQNFIPVVDDTGTFIGIVTRKSILQFLVSSYLKQQEDSERQAQIS